ncbi:IS110 family transposase [Aquitalea sp. LB_tupeE]|nr:IS110 family transposase [Aquitalea sp. LB_tupeE]
MPVFLQDSHTDLPVSAKRTLGRQFEHYHYLSQLIEKLDNEIAADAKNNDVAGRLMTIPRVGPITASQLAADASNAKGYGNARQFAASLGLVPRQHSTGGRPTLLGISK